MIVTEEAQVLGENADSAAFQNKSNNPSFMRHKSLTAQPGRRDGAPSICQEIKWDCH